MVQDKSHYLDKLKELHDRGKTPIGDQIEQIIDEKNSSHLQAALIEALDSEKLKKVATDATIDMMKDDEYIKKLGNELRSNKNVLSSRKNAIINYVYKQAAEAPDKFH